MSIIFLDKILLYFIFIGIWSPGQKIDLSPQDREKRGYEIQQDESLPPVWTPKSANSSPVSERKEFRSVNFQSPVLGRRNRTTSEVRYLIR